jgi:hypothetical protein
MVKDLFDIQISISFKMCVGIWMMKPTLISRLDYKVQFYILIVIVMFLDTVYPLFYGIKCL